jgi:predicted nucleic acid-binding protein
MSPTAHGRRSETTHLVPQADPSNGTPALSRHARILTRLRRRRAARGGAPIRRSRGSRLALGQKVHEADRWIAATALRLDTDLISADTVFQGVPGLSVRVPASG